MRDNVLSAVQQRDVYDFLKGPGWETGWKSNRKTDTYSFLHKHFAGVRKLGYDDGEEPYDCTDELREKAPILHAFWLFLGLKQHKLIRCYSNGHQYGMDGTVHQDSISDKSFTTIYYPHETWDPNWGGETVFFNKERSDIVGIVYPKPNRLVSFRGNIPHVARGVSRTCPVLRITLMFKTELLKTEHTVAEYEAFLTELGVKEVKHSGRTLWDHLKGTYDILCKWGEPEHVCLAGLFHSIYGTEYFQHACLPIDQRGKLISLIGAESERLVYRFCTIPRKEFKERELLTIAQANRLEQKFQDKPNE